MQRFFINNTCVSDFQNVITPRKIDIAVYNKNPNPLRPTDAEYICSCHVVYRRTIYNGLKNKALSYKNPKKNH